MLRKFGAVVTALALSGVVAEAAVFVGPAGLTSFDAFVDFEDPALDDGAVVTGQYGLIFSPSIFALAGLDGVPGLSGQVVANFTLDGAIVSPVVIEITAVVGAASFGFASADGTTTVTALLGGSVVETLMIDTTADDPSQAFLGFTGILFDAIEVSSTGEAFALDNFALSLPSVVPVPLPAPALMGMAALGLLGFIGRSRRRMTV